MEEINVQQVKRINLLQLSLRKELENDDYASLTWGVRENYPRIQVFTSKDFKLPDGTNDYSKLIIAPFTYTIIFTLINALESLAQEDDSGVTKIECLNNKFVDNKRTDEIVVQAEVRIARSQEGIINIGLKNDTTSCYFPLFPNLTYHKFYDKDNIEITDKRILSNLYTLSYVRLLKGTFITAILN